MAFRIFSLFMAFWMFLYTGGIQFIGASVAYAQSNQCDVSDTNVKNNLNPKCFTRKIAGQYVATPRIQWALIGDLKDAINEAYESDPEYVKGSATIAENNRSALLAKMQAEVVPRVVNLFKGSVPIVYARYNPGDSTLRIDAYKAERLASGGIGVFHAVLSPYHGDAWKASQKYLRDDEKTTELGLNPFDRFKGGDEYFHNISFEGALTAMGHYMRSLNSPVGYVINAIPRMHQWKKKCGGGLLKKCIEYHVDGYVKPSWYIAVADDLLPNARTGAICATSTDAEGKCHISKIAQSGVRFQELKGGNMPEWEDKVYAWKKKKTGWTVLAMALFMAALSFVVSLAMGPIMDGVASMIGPVGEAGAATGQSLMSFGGIQANSFNIWQVAFENITGTATGGSALGQAALNAAWSGVTHLGMSAMNGASAGDIHSGLGSGLGGSYSISEGKGEPPKDMDKHERGTHAGIRSRQIDANLHNGGGISAVQSQFSKTKPTTDYREHNTISNWKEGAVPLKNNSDSLDYIMEFGTK